MPFSHTLIETEVGGKPRPGDGYDPARDVTQYGGLTLADYRARANPGTVVVMPDAEVAAYLTEAHTDKKPLRATEEAFRHGLDALPPRDWRTVGGVEYFAVGEPYGFGVWTYFARIGSEYYGAQLPLSMPAHEKAAFFRGGL